MIVYLTQYLGDGDILKFTIISKLFYSKSKHIYRNTNQKILDRVCDNYFCISSESKKFTEYSDRMSKFLYNISKTMMNYPQQVSQIYKHRGWYE